MDAHISQDMPLRGDTVIVNDVSHFINIKKKVLRMSECKINGKFADYNEIIINRQLLDTDLWQKCVNVFSSGIDSNDGGWRGEYWGKMMRGACLMFKVTRSKKLLSVLTDAVNGLLSKQEENGRISSYRIDNELYCWDLWSRKYVMTGLQHFYDICSDEALKGKIMIVLKAHADYIVEHVGDGKINILESGRIWGGVNSASILEPFVRLYKDTKLEKYLDFAKYIIKSGGCIDGSLIDCVNEGKAPYQFTEVKAYETISFFEGLLAFYEVTGEAYYLDVVKRFADKLLETDITVIGSCGCTHELFDNSASLQTECTGEIMQETCVTVTLIRFFSRLYNFTKEKKLVNVIRLASLNALSGSLNINGFDQYCRENKAYKKGLLFDSYSPLCDSKRALGIGGYKEFADGSYFGCCACIASAGFAVYSLTAVTQLDNEISINYLLNGEYKLLTPNGNEAIIYIENAKIKLKLNERECFRLRITAGDAYTGISTDFNNATLKDGFIVIDCLWNDGDEIALTVENKLVEKQLNGKISLNYGGFVLAADTSKSDYYAGKKIEFIRYESGNIKYEVATPEVDEQLRIFAETTDGKMLLTDYSSAGQDGKSIISVWFSNALMEPTDSFQP